MNQLDAYIIQEIECRQAVGSFAEFVRQGWHVVEPSTKLVWNWHLDIICDALQRQTFGEPEYRKLLILIPPGTMKSLLVSVFQPAWQWLHQPSRRKMFVARDDELVIRDSRRTRDIIMSPWYRELMINAHRRNNVEPWTLRRDQSSVVNFANSVSGVRQCQSLGSGLTGKRGDDIVIDDPVDAKSVTLGSSESVRRRMHDVNTIIEKSLLNRVNNLAEARWTIIMQRLDEDDPAGRAIKEGGWKVIQLQMEYDPYEKLNHSRDPRTELGELMFPAMFPLEEIDKLKVKLQRHYSALYQQKPTPAVGSYIMRAWYSDDTLYDETPEVNVYMASDYATKLPQEGDEPDYTEHGVFGYGSDGHVYVLDWWHKQTTSDFWGQALVELLKRWKPYAYFGESGTIWNAVEPSIRAIMREKKVFARIEMLPSIIDKAARGLSFQGMSSMKRWHFKRNVPWSQRIIDQCVNFPTGLHDDAFDTCSLMARAIADAHPAILKKVMPPPKPRDYDRDSREPGGWKTV
jgi:phage terminase large subunit-like protein